MVFIVGFQFNFNSCHYLGVRAIFVLLCFVSTIVFVFSVQVFKMASVVGSSIARGGAPVAAFFAGSVWKS